MTQSSLSIIFPLCLLAALIAGCGRWQTQTQAVDSQPFESAIQEYLERNNMALAIKAVKEGPIVQGDAATIVVSLTHAELGGPSVTWTFQFQRDGDGTWKAVGHEN